MTTVGLLHPGEMGAALGSALQHAGHAPIWASDGRSSATMRRATRHGFRDVGDLRTLVDRSDVLISVCPPDAAVAVAEQIAGFRGTFVDANAIAPRTAAIVAGIVEPKGATYVDGAIVGPPPSSPGDARLYLSGAAAPSIAKLFSNTLFVPRVISGGPAAASALKMTYAAWTKGTNALLLATAAAARELGVSEALAAEWRQSQPQLPGRAQSASMSAAAKGWRWSGEMEQIATTFADASIPPGFHLAAAEVFARVPRRAFSDGASSLDYVISALVDTTSTATTVTEA